MKKVRVGCVGLGPRGTHLVKDAIAPNELFDVAAVCDLMPERVSAVQDALEEAGHPRPQGYTDYSGMLRDPSLDAVVISTAPEMHIPLAIKAMEAGKAAAMEVGGTYNLESCWELVKTSERTGMPCEMLENCCYGRREMMLMNMVRRGVFGRIVHCGAGYRHDLRHLAVEGEAPLVMNNRFYRSRLTQNADRYPTHDLGPVAMMLDINRGNRIVSLTSTASLAAGMRDYIARNPEKCKDPAAADAVFTQGDIVTTVLKCARGETVTLTYDTCLPRFYSRDLSIHGTHGMYQEASDSVFIDGKDSGHESADAWRAYWGNAKDYEAEYDHPVWKEYAGKAIGGHGGTDGLTLHRFAQAVLGEIPFDMDVYDAALWMAVAVLSEQSINRGSAPVDVPDFTGGQWALRTRDGD